MLRRLVRILDKENIRLSQEAYKLAGTMLLNYTSRNRLVNNEDLDESAVDSIDCNLLLTTERAHRYLAFASGTVSALEHYEQTPSTEESTLAVKGTPFHTRSTDWTNSTSTSLQINRPSSPSHFLLSSTTDSTSTPHPRAPLSKDIDHTSNAELKLPLSMLPLDIPQEMLMSNFLNSWQSLVTGLSCQLGETKAELSRSRQLNEQLSKQLNDTSKQLSDAMNKFVECQEKLNRQPGQPTNAAADNVMDAIKLLHTPIRDLCSAINDLRRWLPEGMAAAATAAVNAHFSNSSRTILNNAEAATLMQLYQSNHPFAAFNHLPVQPVSMNWRPPFVQHPLSTSIPIVSECQHRIPSNGVSTSLGTSTAPLTGVTQSNQPLSDLAGNLPRQPNSLVTSNLLFPNSSTASGLSPRQEVFGKLSDLTDNSVPIRQPVPPDSPGRPFGVLDHSEQPIQTSSANTSTLNKFSSFGPTQSTVTSVATEPKPITGFNLFQPPNLCSTTTNKSGSPAVSVTPVKPASTSLFGFSNLNLSGSTPTSSSQSPSVRPLDASFSNVVTPKLPSIYPSGEGNEQSPEAYEPKVDFKPVVDSLPDLVEQYTGEENEERLFADRARLFRFDKPTGSWKTRGVGEVRILHDLKSDKYRLVMRREQVKKLCANHAISSNIRMTISTKDNKMAMWAVRDYAESDEGKDETLMIQFKSTELLNSFVNIFNECVAKCQKSLLIKEASPQTLKASTIITAPGVPTTNVGRAADSGALDLTRFGPKPGEWECPTCLLRNPPNTTKCVACSFTKPSAAEETNKSTPKTSTDSLLDKFAPKPGSWDCPTCMLHHSSSVTACPACQTRKPNSSPVSVASSKPSSSTPLFGGFTMGGGGFVFGQQKSGTPATTNAPLSSAKPLFSFVGSSPKPAANLFTPSASATTVASSPAVGTKPEVSSIAKLPVFYFGKDPVSTEANTSGSLVGDKTGKSDSAFGSINLLGGLDQKGGFSFNFGAAKTAASPLTSPNKNASQGDADQVELVDEDKLAFKPALSVIPDKVEIRTGEEDEEVIFCERAKLYRWSASAWHERGVGDLKLLRNPSSGSVRCLMRRDHVLKVCCNHPITVGMHLKPMNATDGRAWTWWAIDFTEPSPEEEANKSLDQDSTLDTAGGRQQTFAVRFKTIEQAQSFKNLFNEAVTKAEEKSSGTLTKQEVRPKEIQNDTPDTDDVCIIQPPEVTEEQLSRARQLNLPDDFYAFENGFLVGEPELLTEQELEEEDALLASAVQKGAESKQTYSSGDRVGDLSDSATYTSVSIDGDTKSQVTTSPQTFGASDVLLQSNKPSTIFGSLTGSTTNQVFGGFTQSAGKLLDFSALSANLSSDSKPAWADSSTEVTQASSVWASSTTPMFSSAAKQQPQENGTEEAEEHDPHYEPIVSLPELVQATSGEESELCLFFERCRCYRFTDNAWKERGTGDIKVLIEPQSIPEGCHPGSREIVPESVQLGVVKRARLLMRRSQVLKLCINQPIGADIPNFKPMGPSCVCWVGEDYSEGSGVHETLAVRFKKESDLASFKAAVARAQSLLEQGRK